MRYRTATGAAPRLAVALLIACCAGWGVRAQDWGDTPYVQTPQNVVDKMLEIAQVGRDDYVIDLGSGDGRMVITAAKKHGARGFGVDLDRRLVALSNRNAAQAGVADRAAFYQRDLHETDISRASVLSIYLLPEVNLMIRTRILSTLRPGSRVVSHDYDMGEWPPDFQMELPAPGKKVGVGERSKIFYWVVPGKAAGRWRWRLALDGSSAEYDLALNQYFQKIEGTLDATGRSARLEGATLTGEQIAFAAQVDDAKHEYSGRIFNHAIEGKVRVTRGGAASELAWSATRVEIREPRMPAPDPSRTAR